MADTTDPFFAWMNEAHPDGTATLAEILVKFDNIPKDERGIFSAATQAAFVAWAKRPEGLEDLALRNLSKAEGKTLSFRGSKFNQSPKGGAVKTVGLAYVVDNPTGKGNLEFFFDLPFVPDTLSAGVRFTYGVPSRAVYELIVERGNPSGYVQQEKSSNTQSIQFSSKPIGTLKDFTLTLQRGIDGENGKNFIEKIQNDKGVSLETLLLEEWGLFKPLFWEIFGRCSKPTTHGDIVNTSKLGTDNSNLNLEAQEIAALAEKFKQVILYGPPGTGKTHFARKAAKLLAGDEKHIQLVVFHPAYEYDQFIGGQVLETHEGQTRFVAKDGLFVALAKAAAQSPSSKFVLLIDEINRGNLPKLLGELLYGLEYRDKPVRLSYREDAEFSVPPNLYILATMNSADKSIGLIDVAVRRRFAFHRMMPNEDRIRSEWTKKSQKKLGDQLADFAESINADICKAGESGSDPFAEMGIGHSYFLPQDGVFDNQNDFADIWRCKLQPLLVEYFEQGWLPVRPKSVSDIPDLKSPDSWKHAPVKSANDKSETQAATAVAPATST